MFWRASPNRSVGPKLLSSMTPMVSPWSSPRKLPKSRAWMWIWPDSSRRWSNSVSGPRPRQSVLISRCKMRSIKWRQISTLRRLRDMNSQCRAAAPCRRYWLTVKRLPQPRMAMRCKCCWTAHLFMERAEVKWVIAAFSSAMELMAMV